MSQQLIVLTFINLDARTTFKFCEYRILMQHELIHCILRLRVSSQQRRNYVMSIKVSLNLNAILKKVRQVRWLNNTGPFSSPRRGIPNVLIKDSQIPE